MVPPVPIEDTQLLPPLESSPRMQIDQGQVVG